MIEAQWAWSAAPETLSGEEKLAPLFVERLNRTCRSAPTRSCQTRYTFPFAGSTAMPGYGVRAPVGALGSLELVMSTGAIEVSASKSAPPFRERRIAMCRLGVSSSHTTKTLPLGEAATRPSWDSPSVWDRLTGLLKLCPPLTERLNMISFAVASSCIQTRWTVLPCVAIRGRKAAPTPVEIATGAVKLAPWSNDRAYRMRVLAAPVSSAHATWSTPDPSMTM